MRSRMIALNRTAHRISRGGFCMMLTPFDHQPRRYSATHEDAVIDDLRAMAGKHPSGMSANAGGENVDRSALRAPFDEWGDGPGLSSHAIGTDRKSTRLNSSP